MMQTTVRRGFDFLGTVHWRLFVSRPDNDVLSCLLLTVVCIVVGFGMMLSAAVEDVFDRSGSATTVVITSRAASGESDSFISAEAVGRLKALLSAGGYGDLAYDQQIIISTSVASVASRKFVSFRGVGASAVADRSRRIVQGRMFDPNANEVIIGEGVSRIFPSYKTGGSIVLARRTWRISGVFTMNGDVRESEVVGPMDRMATLYGTEGTVNAIRIKGDPRRLASIAALVNDQDQVEMTATRETKLFEAQAEPTVKSLRRLQWLIMALVIPASLLGVLAIQRVQQATIVAELRMLSSIGFTRRALALSLVARLLIVCLAAALIAVLILGLIVTRLTTQIDLGLQLIDINYVATPMIFATVFAMAVAVGLAAGAMLGIER